MVGMEVIIEVGVVKEVNGVINGLLISGLLEPRSGLLEVTKGLDVVRAAVVLFIHFSMCPFNTSLRLNFLPHNLQGYEAVIPHSYLW
jgi:hypothetical protein